jgi:hypothetical protein
MSNVINGIKLSKGNFMIELTESQLDDLETMYLGQYLKWSEMSTNQKDVEQMEIHYSIANDYYKKYQAIKEIRTK